MKVSVMQVGPIGTNCYFLQDEETGLMAIIDPGDDWEAHPPPGEEGGGRGEVHPPHPRPLRPHHRRARLGEGPARRAGLHPPGRRNGAGSQLFPLAAQVKDLNNYDEGDTLTLGSLTIEVMHTPGHSKGSVTLKVGDVLFTGDTLFCGSCGRTDLRGGSYEQMMQSLKRLGELKGDFHVCPGHEATSTWSGSGGATPS